MRNWNIKDFIDDVLISFLLYLTYEELKHFIGAVDQFLSIHIVVPYLWGIETVRRSTRNILADPLYLTYEELKLSGVQLLHQATDLLYLTYEELKRLFFFNLLLV